MKGTEVTAEQMAAAKSFLLCGIDQPIDDSMISQQFEDLVRLLAWYGAIRYQAALRSVCRRKYMREEFPIPCVLPMEIRDQILNDEGLQKPNPGWSPEEHELQ